MHNIKPGLRYILVIDDEPAMLDYYSVFLKKLDDKFVFFGADSNHEAKKLLDQNQFKLIISDVARPGGNGIEFLKFLRADSTATNQKTPAIAISGQVGRGTPHSDFVELSLYRVGYNRVLSKPFSPKDFLFAVQVVLPELSTSTGEHALIYFGRETPSFDYKETVDFSTKDSIASLAKDVIAMGNSGGGTIIIGVSEVEKGSFQPVGITNEDLSYFESTNVNKALRPFIDPPPHVAPQIINLDGLHFVQLTIPPATEEPLMTAKANDRAGLFTGRIYIRNSACESCEIKTSHELRVFLNRFINNGKTKS